MRRAGQAVLLALLCCLGARADLGAHPLRSALTSFVHEAAAAAEDQRPNAQALSAPLPVEAHRSQQHWSQRPERAAKPEHVEAEEEDIARRVARQVAAERRRGTAAGTPHTAAEIQKLDSMMHLVDSELAMRRLKHEQGQTTATTRGSVVSEHAVSPFESPVSAPKESQVTVMAVREPAVAKGHIRVGLPPGTTSGQMMQVMLPGIDKPVRFEVPEMAPGDKRWRARVASEQKDDDFWHRSRVL